MDLQAKTDTIASRRPWRAGSTAFPAPRRMVFLAA